MFSRVRLFATPWIVAWTRLLHPWDFPSKSTREGSISFLSLIGRGSLQMWLRLLTWDDSVLCWWALNTITCNLIRRGRLDLQREDDVKVMAGLETCGHRSRVISSKRNWKRSSSAQQLLGCGHGRGLLTSWILPSETDFWASDFQNYKTINFCCCFKPLVHDPLLQ